jgi:hypothetical protein
MPYIYFQKIKHVQNRCMISHGDSRSRQMCFSLGNVKTRGRFFKAWWQNFATKEAITYRLEEPQVT